MNDYMNDTIQETQETQETPQRILTIDDDAMIRLMIEDMLSCEGFEVVCATDGQSGLEMFHQCHPDLVLLDVVMPKMDGFDCLQALRALPGSSLLPIVMLTAADDEETIHRSFGLGATDFITKPINWPTLPYRLRYMMQTSVALENLARSEAVLHNTQKIARLGNWEWQVNTDHVTWSQEALTMLGVAPENFHSPKLTLFKTVQTSDALRLQQALELCITKGRSFSLEIRLVYADGLVHVMHIQGEAEIQ